jgi:hypothetical protein
MLDGMKPREPQPWHPADEKKPAARRGGPIGTHSLTGGRAEVGLPSSPGHEDGIERSEPRDPVARPTTGPDLVKEPRAGGGDLLGRKP